MRESMKYNPGYYQLREGQLRRILAIMEQTKTARPGGVVFFGDSLTECYPIERCFPEIENKYNCGIGGAVAEELLWVVDEAVVKYDPELVVLMVGINDLGNTVMSSPREIARNVKNVIDLVRGNCPQAKVLLYSTLPCIEALRSYHQVPGIRSNNFSHMIFTEYQELILDRQTELLDVFPAFVDEAGEARREFYVDGLHLNDAGYDRLTRLLAPSIFRMIGTRD